MCAIVGSNDVNTLKELIGINSKRGSFSYSFTVIDENYNILFMKKDFGTFDYSLLTKDYNNSSYFIAHIQAPTGGLIEDYNRIHPTHIEDKFLWHNGILKDYYVKELKDKFNSDVNWDTELLLMNINDIEDLDGTFSCLLLDEGKSLKLFRNSDSPMFIDDDMNISSTKFIDANNTKPNTMYSLDLKNCIYEPIMEWVPKHNSPYFFG